MNSAILRIQDQYITNNSMSVHFREQFENEIQKMNSIHNSIKKNKILGNAFQQNIVKSY